MADPGDINLKLLSLSTNGLPIKIASTTLTTPTNVHVHDGATQTVDLVYLWICNTSTTLVVDYAVLVYAGATATDPDSIADRGSIPPKSGAWVALQHLPIQNSVKVGVAASVADLLTVTGKVGKATVAA